MARVKKSGIVVAAVKKSRGISKVINWKIVKNCGKAQCNIKETAAIIGVSEVTLRERCLKENDTDIKSFIEGAHQDGKACLRRKLYKMANDGKNWPALKFALSNYLKMYEKNELEVMTKQTQYTDEERVMLRRLALEKAQKEIENPVMGMTEADVWEDEIIVPNPVELPTPKGNTLPESEADGTVIAGPWNDMNNVA